jgi:ribonuclease BN (tRNA processing enzyme)
MRLTIVGMSGSYPGPDSPASCYLLEQEYAGRTHRVVIDLGNGSLGPLQRYIDLADLDAVLLSHLHADHCLDMCGFYVYRRYYAHSPTRLVPVYGPAGTAERLAGAYDLPSSPGMTGEFDFRTYDDEPFAVGPFRVTAVPVVHPVPSYGLRFESDGATLAYSGDTGACDAVLDLAEGADLFLCEASFVEGGDNPEDLHLTGREAAEYATRAKAQRLVLTHVPPIVDPQRVLDDAKPAFDGPIDLAVSGVTYSL